MKLIYITLIVIALSFLAYGISNISLNAQPRNEQYEVVR